MIYNKVAMKKLSILLLISMLFSGCYFWSEIDYELINNTNYDVTIFDNDVNKTEYFLKANSKTTISHTNSAQFSIKDNSFPVTIKNTHTYSSIENLKTFDLNVINNTSDSYVIKQTNQTYGNGEFIISGNFNNSIKMYTNTTPAFKLYKNDMEYLNYNYQKSTLNIN